MPLSRYEIKERLGHGGVSAVAAALGLSVSHVSRVLNEKRSDRRVALAVARKLRIRLADLPTRYLGDRSAA